MSPPRPPTRSGSASEAQAFADGAPARRSVPPSRLKSLCEAQLESETDPARKARLHYEIGRLSESELGDRREAATHYRAALHYAPDHVAAIRAARRALLAIGDHAAVPPLFDAEIALTGDPSARARLLYAKGRVLETKLAQPAASLAVYREALALDPGNVTILGAIERGHRRDGSWSELASTYVALASAIEDPTLKAARIATAAHLRETKLGDPEGAAALYESALETDPHASAALAHVKRLARAHGRWHSLIGALRTEHSLCSDPDAKHAILTLVAEVQEKHLADVSGAMKTLEEALAVRPHDRALLSDVARLIEAHGRAPVAPLARLAEQTEEPRALATICHRLGRIFEQDLGDATRARPWYERALTADPTHAASALALARLYEEREDWTELLRVWATRANAIADTREQASIFDRMGTLLETKHARPDDAARHHARALALDPDHHAAFRALTRLHTAAGRWRELADLYARAIDRAPHDAQAMAWLFRLGAVLEDRLGDLAGALAAYERILARDPASLGALHAIARAAERAGRFDRVVEVLRIEASLSSDPARRDALLHEAAVRTADQLGDASGAMRALESLLASSPSHRPSLETAAELAERAGQWDRVVAIHERLLPLSTPREQVRLHHRIGEIRAAQLGAHADAVRSFTSALALDPELELAREARIEALTKIGAFRELASALEERMARMRTPIEQARAATAIGAIYEEKLNDRARALASYESALALVPLHRPALDARERLLTEARDAERLANALAEEAARTEDPFERTQSALRSALVRAEAQGAAALGSFRPVFASRPDHVGALLAVEDVYRSAGDAAGLAATYERLASVLADPSAKLAALAELSAAREVIDGDASAVARQILTLAPDDPAALETLATSAERAGDVETEIAAHARLASGAREATAAAHHHVRVGELLLAKSDAIGALASFRSALAADPQSLGATDGLTRAARAARDPAAMREAARYETLVTRDQAGAVALLRDAARAHFEAGREDDAAACYAEALSLAPDDPEAATGLMATMMKSERIPQLCDLLTRAAHAATDPSRAAVLHRAVALFSADVLGDIDAAVAATRRALAARPGHDVTIESLATYLERSGQWIEAAATLEEWMQRARGDALIAAHLRLARIAERHLREPDRAMRSLRVVLSLAPNDAEALTSLVRLERLRGNDAEALRLARTLITVVEDEVQRAAALSELAELEKARGQLDEAAKAAYWAIGVQGPAGNAARLYRSLIASAPQHASWDHYVAALMSYVQRAKAHGGDIAAGYRELARVFGEARHQPDRAIAALREGVSACPLDASISLALVNALLSASADAEALEELRRFLGVDVLEVGAWRALADVLRRMGAPDASTALAPLLVLGQASADEEQAVRSRRIRPAAAPATILGESGLKRLLDTSALEESPALVIPLLGEIITKLEGIDYERWGVSKRDRVRASDVHPLRALADRIGRIFGGVPEYDLFVGVTSVVRPFILSGSPPALLVPAKLESAPDPALAFHLARPLALLSRGLHSLDHVDDAAMERILVATVRQFDPSFVLDPIMDEDALDAETKRVARAIGFFSRSRIQEAATLFASSPRSIGSWAREIRRLAARAALLVADDLVATLEALGERLGDDNYASDLARFWISDPAMRFRRAVAQQP